MTDPEQPEHRFWDLSRFEWIMAVLTFLGLLITVFTGLILYDQLHEMKVDQRAWMSLSMGTVQFPKDLDSIGKVPVSAPITITNIGKTAARNIHTQAVMDYEVNGSSPDFIYDRRPRSEGTTGIMFPNSPFPMPATFMEGKQGGGTQPRYLTAAEYQDLTKGDGYMVVYVETTYTDIFGSQHWLHFCQFFASSQVVSPVTVTSKACTDYNDTDHE